MSENKEPILDPQKFYLKDVSFESPNAPMVFQDESEPETEFNINTSYSLLAEDVYEVVLSLTIKVTNKTGTVLLIELEQAGIFTVQNFPEEELEHILHAYCGNILFPYAREEVSSLTTKGGFPPLLLAPINFDALFEQQMQTSDEAKH